MSTQLIRSSEHLTPLAQGSVLTIGHFDGVHRGHQQLVERVITEAREFNAPSMVVTFEPHAFEFFNKAKVTTPRLTRLREKWTALAETGVDYVYIIKFNQQVANLSASDFVTHVLWQNLHPRHIVIGDDFRFGHLRQGDFSLLQQMGRHLGFTVEAMSSFLLAGERVSSSRVRQALALGDLDLVSQLLGHRYYMLGRIRHGEKLGRQWGFPTINIDLHRALTPIQGIYTVYVHGLDVEPLQGVASIGTRPTIDGTKTLLEVHLLDFNREVYGHYVKVEFCKKLREEIRYPTIDLLKEQIARDVLSARNYFNEKTQ